MEEKPRLEQIASCYAGGPALVTGIGLQSFSLTLALRYLNPKRTYFSLITLVCLLGVAVGVMVLIVVLMVLVVVMLMLLRVIEVVVPMALTVARPTTK